jgi:hypothetical protein
MSLPRRANPRPHSRWHVGSGVARREACPLPGFSPRWLVGFGDMAIPYGFLLYRPPGKPESVIQHAPLTSSAKLHSLLDRFMRGEDYRERRVTISDSGRIRNLLQTLCTEALEHFGENGIRLHFRLIPDDVIPPSDRVKPREVLAWYKTNRPI